MHFGKRKQHILFWFLCLSLFAFVILQNLDRIRRNNNIVEGNQLHIALAVKIFFGGIDFKKQIKNGYFNFSNILFMKMKGLSENILLDLNSKSYLRLWLIFLAKWYGFFLKLNNPQTFFILCILWNAKNR